MKKSNVRHLRVGTTIRCKHNLGVGEITEIRLERGKSFLRGRYPMIQYRNEIGELVWCTYLIIDNWTPTLESVS